MNISHVKTGLLSFAAFALFSGVVPGGYSAVYADDQTAPTVEKSTAENLQQEVSETAESIKKYTVEQRDEAVAEAKKQMNELDARIEHWQNQLDAKRDQMSQSAQENWQASIKNLQEQRNKLSEWFGGMKHSSVDTWENIKKGFSQAYSSVENSLQKAQEKSRLGE